MDMFALRNFQATALLSAQLLSPSVGRHPAAVWPQMLEL